MTTPVLADWQVNYCTLQMWYCKIVSWCKRDFEVHCTEAVDGRILLTHPGKFNLTVGKNLTLVFTSLGMVSISIIFFLSFRSARQSLKINPGLP